MKLIVGGTGALGSAVVRRLRSAGEPVRVLTRDPEGAAAVSTFGAELVRGDLRDRASLERACHGVDAVVAAAHALFGRGAAASASVDNRGNRDLIDVSKAAGVGQFVFLSLRDMGPECASVPFIRIKYDVERYLKDSGLTYTILRPTAFMEQHAHMLIGEPILRTGKTVVFGRGEQPRNFVAADDVARVVVRVLADPAFAGRTIDVGGPENLTAMDVVRLYERKSGRKARVRHLPLTMLRGLSWLLRPVHPGVSQVMQMSALFDRVDQSFDASPLRQEFGFELTTLEEWLDGQLSNPVDAAAHAQ